MAKYAWSPILTHEGVIGVGEVVKPDAVGGKDAFEELVEAGAIRDAKYPDTDLYESPREHNLRKLNEAIEKAAESAYADIDFDISAPEEPVVESAVSES